MAMFRRVILLGVFACTAYALPQRSVRKNPDAGLDVNELIQKHGYPLERHTIQTEDGYLLQVQRIPHGLTNSTPGNVPVLFLHGLTSSSTDWINAGVGKSLAYALADLGYDVWLGNIRGNMWGRNHVTLDPDVDKEEFWDFSFHESGIYDIPATIDYILDINGADSLFYIGHSQGTASFFAMASERPEYNEKIKMMFALGPVAFMDHIGSAFIKLISKHTQDIEWILDNIGLYEFLPNTIINNMLSKICEEEAPTIELCENVYFLICGYDSEQLDPAMLSVITTNLPAGSSTKQFLHFGQEIESGYFRKWDYHSEEKNLEVYGQPTPPEYDLSKITTPIALYYGKNDKLVGVEDAERLAENLPNVAVNKLIDFEYFNHGDFLWAIDVFELLYNDIIENVLKHT